MSGRAGGAKSLWRRRVEEQRGSGLSIREYCERHGIGESSFYGWKRRLKGSIGADSSVKRLEDEAPRLLDSSVSPFVSVRLSGSPAGVLEFVHPGGCSIRFAAGFAPEVLRDVLAVLDGEEA